MLFSAKMEMLLNLAWLLTSAILVGVFLRRERGRGQGWLSVTALCLLILLLLPTISMTDDLMAMNSPAETEHMLRQDDSLFVQSITTGLAGAVGLVPIVLSLVSPLEAMEHERDGGAAVRRLQNHAQRCCGVRPPPVSALL